MPSNHPFNRRYGLCSDYERRRHSHGHQRHEQACVRRRGSDCCSGHASSSLTQWFAASFILFGDLFCCTAECAAAIVKEGGIPAIISAMKTHPKIADVQRYGCWSLTNVAISKFFTMCRCTDRCHVIRCPQRGHAVPI